MTQPTRRDFIVGAGALASAALAGCTSSSPTAAPGSAAATTAAVPKATTPPAWKLNDVEHVVIFMQENRSFDQYFGIRPGVRGFADPDVLKGPGGKPIWYQPSNDHPEGFVLPFPVDSLGSSGQVLPGCDHSWPGMHAAWNAGKMDGFAKTSGSLAMPYYGREDIPYYWALADQFTLCDEFFCSAMAPTLPNRYYSMTGTIDPDGKSGGPEVDNDGNGYEWETYPERLQRAGISWRIYHEVDDYDDNAVKNFRKYMDAKPGDPLYDNALVNLPPDGFERDVQAGNLPQVSWIVAPTGASEHPPFAPAQGENYTAKKLGALLAKADLWAKTMFILTYDESDGLFDHVAPPVAPKGTAGEFVGDIPIGLGFRVPTLIISPFTRGGVVATKTFDHTSVLRLLESRFGVEVPNLSKWRRETSNDLVAAFDFSKAPDAGVPSLPDTEAHLAAVTNAVKTKPLPSPPNTQKPPVG